MIADCAIEKFRDFYSGNGCPKITKSQNSEISNFHSCICCLFKIIVDLTNIIFAGL